MIRFVTIEMWGGTDLPRESWTGLVFDSSEIALRQRFFIRGVGEMVIPLDRFIERLDESTLISAEQLNQVLDGLSASQRPGDAEELARLLTRSKRLTPFQAAAIQKGEHQRLVLNEYELLKRLGVGGMGEVFLATQGSLQRPVALKVISDDFLRGSPDAIERFHKEMQATAMLSHGNIVQAFHAGVDKGVHYLVLEIVDGRSLSELLENGPLSIEEAVWYILQAARGFAHAHDKGVVHRDVKPGNLLVSRDGVLKINDFGLARLVAASTPGLAVGATNDEAAELTRSNSFLGTYAYTAPEQALDPRDASALSDIYSLGCTLYRAIVGRTVFKADSLLKMAIAHREQSIPSLCDDRGDVSPELDVVFQRMVAKNPVERFQSMQEVVAALQECGPWGAVSEVAAKQDAKFVVEIPVREETSDGTNGVGPDDETCVAARDEQQRVQEIEEASRSANRLPSSNRSRGARSMLIGFVLVLSLLAIFAVLQMDLLTGPTDSPPTPVVPTRVAPRAGIPTAHLQFVKAGQVEIGAGRKINAIGFLKDTRLLYVAVVGGIEVWNHDDKKMVASHAIANNDEVKCVSYDVESRRLVVGCRSGEVRMLDDAAESKKWTRLDDVSVALNQVCILSGGKQLFAATQTDIFLIDLETAKRLKRETIAPVPAQIIHDAAVSSDGSLAVLGRRHTEIDLWDIKNWCSLQPANTEFGKGKMVARVAFAPNDRSYFGGIYGNPDPTILIQQFDLTGKPLSNFGIDAGVAVKTLAVLDAYDLLLAGVGNQLIGWGIEDGETIKSENIGFGVECLAVADTNLIAVAQGTWTSGDLNPGIVQLFRLEVAKDDVR